MNLAVLMACHDRAATTLACLERLDAALRREPGLYAKVFLVDDGSSDATAAAAEQAAAECAAERGSSFRLVRQANAGAYTARVRALAGVETPYFAFVDADDAVEPSMYERLLAFSRANDLDIAQCDAVGAACAAVPQELFLGEAQVREKVVLPRLLRGEGAVSVWDKVYRNRLGGAGFEPSDIMMFEDLAINLQLFVGAERVGYLHEGLYRYDVNPGSSVRNFRLKNVSDLREAIRFRKTSSALFASTALRILNPFSNGIQKTAI